jgi:hypothetical protein
LFIALMAFGDSVIGEPLREMVDRERTAGRKVAAFLLPKFFLESLSFSRQLPCRAALLRARYAGPLSGSLRNHAEPIDIDVRCSS